MKVPIVIRKFRSLLLRVFQSLACYVRIAIIRLKNDGTCIPWSTFVGPGVDIRITDDGQLRLGAYCTIEAGARIVIQNAVVHIGASTFIGRGSTLVALQSIKIGQNSLIAEYVSIRDQTHIIDSHISPMHSGFDTSPIDIGDDVWIGAKATILQGVRLGAGAIVGAHALVRCDIPDRAIAVGVPARILRFRANDKDE